MNRTLLLNCISASKTHIERKGDQIQDFTLNMRRLPFSSLDEFPSATFVELARVADPYSNQAHIFEEALLELKRRLVSACLVSLGDYIPILVSNAFAHLKSSLVLPKSGLKSLDLE